jgi:hypothetical protein
LRIRATKVGYSHQHKVVLMDDMEEYTINKDLRACGPHNDNS